MQKTPKGWNKLKPLKRSRRRKSGLVKEILPCGQIKKSWCCGTDAKKRCWCEKQKKKPRLKSRWVLSLRRTPTHRSTPMSQHIKTTDQNNKKHWKQCIQFNSTKHRKHQKVPDLRVRTERYHRMVLTRLDTGINLKPQGAKLLSLTMRSWTIPIQPNRIRRCYRI